MAYQATPGDSLRRSEFTWKAEGRQFDPAPGHHYQPGWQLSSPAF